MYTINQSWEVISNNYNSSWKILKQYKKNSWYMYVVLSKWNCTHKHYIHRLVLLTFIGESELLVNHIDWVKTNNNLDNLEYVTRSENQLHAYKNGLQKVICNKWVHQYDSDNNFIKSYKSIVAAAKELNLFPQNIWKACKGIYQTCWGFIWKYT